MATNEGAAKSPTALGSSRRDTYAEGWQRRQAGGGGKEGEAGTLTISISMAVEDTKATLTTLSQDKDCEKGPAEKDREATLASPSKNEPCKNDPGKEVSVNTKHVVLALVVSMVCILDGAANRGGWTAVLPKMQEDPNIFTVTDSDVVWLVSMASIVTIFASLFAGPLVEWAGPQRVLTVSLALSTVLWLLMAFPNYKAVLFVAKAGLSACSGVVATLQMPLLAEVTPAKMRGTLGTMADVWGGTGLIFGYLMAHLFTWRVATALCSLTGGLLVIPMLLVPESPYWLVRRGRLEAAKASLQRLMGSEAAAEDELSAISSMPAATQNSGVQQFTELTKGHNARPVLLVMSCFVLRELGGRSCIMMYTVYLFREAGVQLDAFMCTVLVGLTRTLSSCLAAAVLDKVGRRPMLAGTAVLGGAAQVVCGLFLHLQLSGASWVPLAAVLVFVAAYGAGIGPIPWLYVGELLPSPVRSLGASLITTCDAVAVFVINYAFFSLIDHIGLGVTFMAFAALNFLIAVVVWLWIPESRGVSLQELENIFKAKS
ncbi:facilitated trehalose transporter Tret1-like [Eriocheir sinensis]|uniref:facilitated trehalose transporter Tret1-like n=1 Tax=Eriocheir sinensis TaxID=95602 RepID=UPI0021CAA27B|nr:facilitated trehalose transporter Tret1-like [Eriocheir sinensis]